MDARLRVVVDLARRLGLRVEQPVVLRDRSNLLVRLDPAPVVARVAGQTTVVRHGPAWLAREIEVARFLGEAGAPVVPPSPLLPAGPHEYLGLVISFWTAVQEVGEVDPVAAGAALRRCHELLAGFEGDLPRWGALREVERILDRLARTEALDASRARKVLHLLRDRITAAALPEQAVHGDAHLGNVLQTADGPRWNDWEDAFAGPTGWDLACLLASDRPGSASAAASTADEVPADALAALVEARRLQAAAWSVVLGRARGDDAMAERGLTALSGP
ncbi:phosphotransferase family protein [Amnibacterium endophyticum]|uniref:Phosphotransferase family protein n=1 Tax=Amnibacterium endophyticum TaxID=2109337 RepID=A0ABW4LB46_9MICO